MSLETFSPDTSPEILSEALIEQGACIVRDVIDDKVVQQMTDEVMPYIETTPMGNDEFSGRSTQRTGALIARTPTCRDLTMNRLILDAAHTFLGPYTDKIILHLTQTIYIHPGSPAQTLHRDRLAWGTHIPREIEPQFNTIWALTDFTAENGATRCIPGSNKWDWDKRGAKDQIVQAQMSAGSVFLYSGSVLHSGGENQSDTPRLGLNLTYTLGWLRQEENQYLSCPPHIAKDLEPDLQDLLGYTQGNYALGYYSDPENRQANRDILPPEIALGRKPNSRFSADVLEGD